jgi:hypothetical protein
MCRSVDTEIGGMGIGSVDNPLLLTDFIVIPQTANPAFVSFDPDKYADIMMELCDPEGAHKLKPQQCQRVWVH